MKFSPKNNQIKDIKVEPLAHHKYLLNKVSFKYLKENGEWELQQREVYERGNGAVILLYNLERRTILLTRQFRLPTFLNGNGDGHLIEACAGHIDDDNPDQTAIKETEEELGYRIDQAQKIFELYMSPGSVTEILHFYIAAYDANQKVSQGGGLEEEQEHIEVLELSFEKAYEMMLSGKIRDAKTIILLQYIKLNNIL
ncbi:MAG: NUDIX domain-containing protein [Candidatus Cyclobacteriaceae bacterium M3_2C_046]